MSGFAALGLTQQLVDAAISAGWEEPLPIQRAAIPVLRRGGNAVLRAGHGAGVTGAYGLALLDRLAGGAASAAPRALVVV
ncbi:MAG: DEAD/DEAH box helicase, partial [Longimicrobiales bacterium]